MEDAGKELNPGREQGAKGGREKVGGEGGRDPRGGAGAPRRKQPNC